MNTSELTEIQKLYENIEAVRTAGVEKLGLESDASLEDIVKHSTVLGLENAIVIQEKDAHFLLHEYTEVDYISGNKIGYSGLSNQIIISGYSVVKNGLDGEAPVYSEATFAYGDESGIFGNDLAFYAKLTVVTTSGAVFEMRTKSSNLADATRYSVTSPSGKCGFIFTWTNIYPANERYPFGYVTGYWRTVYYNSDDTKQYIDGRQVCLGFSSEAEYNAAVGLTYEPNTLTTVQETITVE